MSHVAHLSVVTKTKTDTCAWKASYSDGKLVQPQPGQTPDPKPCAGNDGTIITIEDLFHNTPTRLAALRSPSEEYSRILDVLTKYAIHNPNVAFICKKAGTSAPDLATPSASSTSQAIRMLYGHSIAKELLSADVSSPGDQEKSESWKAEAHFTNANYQSKKTIFLLFINHRLVESSRMKRALEVVYNGILPKGSFPFIYLSLVIDPRSVDVNVHPTKKEVHFLNEETIVERISDAILETLSSKGESRIFEYQTLLTAGGTDNDHVIPKKRKDKEREHDIEPGTEGAGITPNATQAESRKKVSSHLKVRTSLKDRTLDSMFPIMNSSQIGGSSRDRETEKAETSQSRDIKESECILTSVQTLRKNAIKGKHRLLTEILEKHTFVGIVDVNQCLSLVQHSTNLYLVNHASLAEELFYQLGLPEDIPDDTPLKKPQIVERDVGRILLFGHFPNGFVASLPLLLRDYTPNLDKVPSFLMRLGPQVNWTSEQECFESFLRELAHFYVPGPAACFDASIPLTEEQEVQNKAERWQIEHVLFPSMRRYLAAPKSLLDADVVQVANLPDLYKVFERC
ncbi:hypothetical protein BDZ89DRAFT_1074184 [Hymenopellis radicata]|nr:hypothetical protein BDZ89DRAFT_1074184 [Hymenopellis radicata]